MNMHVPALQRSLSDVVAEYDTKLAGIGEALAAFTKAGEDLGMAATIGGTYGRTNIEIRGPYESALQQSLLKSAWYHVHDGLNIKMIASPNDKRMFEQAMANPPPFTLENIRATFGKYIADPRGNILRGLAEVFCGLDDFYKSHDKVKIGVAGLPKRVILSNVAGYGSYGREKLFGVLNALAAYRGEPLAEHAEFGELDTLHRWVGHTAGTVVIRGLTVKKFQNGNAHVMFDKASLRDINMALAEFYGEVLCDTTDEKPTKKQASTAVSKDLQYYPTPQKVIDDHIIHRNSRRDFEGKRVLDPSCGCGRLMDAARKAGAIVTGIEVDAGRAREAAAKGHSVICANFLDAIPDPANLFDIVLMNPPFYGKHYAKHVEHAFKFLKPGGVLIAILPATARYDHGLLKGSWDDLPVGSFSESGTNINTTVLTMHRRD